MTDKKDYYSILGVSKSASAKEIKDSYRKLASQHHPDKGGVEAKFKEIQEAYDILGNEDSRHKHDNSGFSNAGFNQHFNNGFHFDFSDFLNTHQARQSQKIYQANISLEDAYTGTNIESQLGTINVPKGIRSGTKVLVNQASLVHINVANHHKFTRDFDNLVMRVSITSLEAITGIDLSIKHLDGTTIKTKIPPLVKYSQSIRLLGKGMPNPETSGYGDLYLVVIFDTPTDLTMVEKDAILKIVSRTNLSI